MREEQLPSELGGLKSEIGGGGRGVTEDWVGLEFEDDWGNGSDPDPDSDSESEKVSPYDALSASMLPLFLSLQEGMMDYFNFSNYKENRLQKWPCIFTVNIYFSFTFYFICSSQLVSI